MLAHDALVAFLQGDLHPRLQGTFEQTLTVLKRSAWTPEQSGQMLGLALVQRPDQAKPEAWLAYAGLSPASGVLCQRELDWVPPAFDVKQRAAILSQQTSELEQLAQRAQALGFSANLLYQPVQQAQEKQAELAKFRANKLQRRTKRLNASVDLLAKLDQESRLDTYERKQTQKRFAGLAELSAQVTQLIEQQDQRVRQACVFRLASGRSLALSEVTFSSTLQGEVGHSASLKLLKQAQRVGAEVLALTQFWWGAASDADLRQHARVYPPCRGKCLPVLQALMADAWPILPEPETGPPQVVFEDAELIVVNKPAGLRSVDGAAGRASLQAWACEHFEQPIYTVHRLDMPTSGLLLLSKTSRSQTALMQAFAQGKVEKTYQAQIEGRLSERAGEIRLALSADPNERPRQRVCATHGKVSHTRWQWLNESQGRTRLALEPVTGRTHQLRLHLAHARGLNRPIVGDTLYGFPDKRMHLHAKTLSFTHPQSGRRITLDSDVPF